LRDFLRSVVRHGLFSFGCLPLDCDMQRSERPAEDAACKSAACGGIAGIFLPEEGAPRPSRQEKYREVTFCKTRRGRYTAEM